MKSITITILVLLSSFIMFAQSQVKTSEEGKKRLEENNGFQSIKLGSSASKFFKNNDLKFEEVPTKKVEDTKVFNCFEESLRQFKIDDIKVTGLMILSFKDTIFQIVVMINKEDGNALLEALEIEYGRGLQKNKSIQQYEWASRNIIVCYDMENSVPFLFFEYIPIIQSRKQAKNQKH